MKLFDLLKRSYSVRMSSPLSSSPLGLFLLLLVCSPFSRAVEVKAPLFEEYLQGGRVAAYVQEALAFLEANPQSLYAPRVANDLLIIATALKNEQLAVEAKRRLLLDYPASVQSTHLVSTFEEAKELREFLVDIQGPVGESEFAGRFCRVVKAGFRQFGAEFLNDADFQLRCYLHSLTAGDDALKNAVLPQLREDLANDKEDFAELAIALDDKLSDLEKLRRLHALLEHEESATLEFCIDFFAAALPKSERSSPEIVKILAERAVWGSGGKQALVLLDALPKAIRSDAKYRVLRAKVLWAESRAEDALKDLVQATSGAKPWSRTATDFADGVRSWDERRALVVQSILGISKSFGKDTTGLDAEISFSKKDDEGKTFNYTAYLGMIPNKNLLQLHVSEGESVKFAYRTDAKSSGLYLAGADKIMRFATSGPVPAPNFTLEREEGGGFNLQGGATIASSLDAARKSGANLLDSPYLSTVLGLNTLLEHSVRRIGGWIEKPRQEGKTTYLSVRTLQRFNALGLRVTVGVHETGALASILVKKLDGSSRLEVGKIRYGGDSFELRPAVWPDLAFEDRKEFDFSVITQVMGAIGKALADE
ncbi:MAG: hypothetical protein CMI31_07020 [Opitutae bacterium]|nr:hypothetical protein [Opitutae bacterium]